MSEPLEPLICALCGSQLQKSIRDIHIVYNCPIHGKRAETWNTGRAR